MRRKGSILLVSALVLLVVAGCGRKNDPLPKSLASPGTVSDLSGETKDGVLFLSFSLPAQSEDGSRAGGIVGYTVLKNCMSCLGIFERFREIRLDDERGYTTHGDRLYLYDDDLVPGYQYAYRVSAFTAQGTRGNLSSTLSVAWEKPPDPPRSLSVRETDGMVELTWPTEAGARYNVYRWDDSVYPLFARNDRLLQVGSYVDTGLDNGTKYRYEVRTVVQDKAGVRREGAGATVYATPKDLSPPPAPANLEVRREGTGILITWEMDPLEDVDGYHVYRVAGSKRERITSEPVDAEWYFDIRPPALRYMTYSVTAVDRAGNESDQSREVTILLRTD